MSTWNRICNGDQPRRRLMDNNYLANSLRLPERWLLDLLLRVQAASAATAEVKIDNFSFEPQTITIPVGATVTWTNRDDIPHTVVSTDGVFKSKVRDTDEKFSYTFTKAGTYPYFCSVHPKMTGKVVVQ